MEAEIHDGTANAPETGLDPAESVGALSERRASPRSSRGRLIGVRLLIAVTTLLLIVGMFSVWANRLLFDPDNWSNTSTQLLQNPAIRSATANYLVDQLYSNVNVADVIKSGLPPQLRGLSAPAAGALRNAAVQGTELALSRPQVQNLWRRANRTAAQSFIAVVNGGNRHVGVNQGTVTLNLGPMLDDVATRLGLPSNLSSHLPPNIATLTVFKSDQIRLVQNGGKLIKGLALWLTILVPLLYVLAIVLAPGHRRRTLMTVGFAGLFAGVVVLLGRAVLETQLTNSLTDDASLKPAIRAAIAIGTGLLSEIAGAVILVCLVLVVAAWFGGPARIARAGREMIAPFVRQRPVATFAITLGVMALVFIWDPIHATGTPAGIIVFTLLALLGTELLIRQTKQEFPQARAGATSQAVRARWMQMRDHRRQRKDAAPSAPPPTTTAEQLRQLAELRDHGDITPDEYQAAKAQLLNPPD